MPQLSTIDVTVSRLRRRRRVTVLLWTTTLGVALAMVLGVMDYLVHIPMEWRVTLVVVAAIATMAVLVRRWSSGVSAPQQALGLARVLESQRPPLRGWLMAAVELRQSNLHEGAQQCVTEAQRRLDASGPVRVTSQGVVAAVFGLVVITAALVGTAMTTPALCTISAQRLFTPWQAPHWPARTSVESTMGSFVHGRGLPLQLTARNTTPDGGHEPVSVAVRFMYEGGGHSDVHAQMHHQHDDQHALVIDVPVDAVSASATFHTEDAASTPVHLQFKPLPALAAATLTLTPPWTHAQVVEPQAVQMHGGLPQPSRPVLAGTQVDLQMTFEDEVMPPRSDAEWLQDTFMTDMDTLRVTGTSRQWTLHFTAHDDTRLMVRLEDEHGLQAVDRPTFTLKTTGDAAPQLKVLEPSHDVSRPTSATIVVAGSAEDDYPLQSVQLRVEPRSGWMDPWVMEAPSGSAFVRVEGTLSLASQGATVGDVIEVHLEAVDLGDPTTGHRLSRSRSCVIRVIDDESWQDEVQAMGRDIASTIQHLLDAQVALRAASHADRWGAQERAGQRRLARSLGEAAEQAMQLVEAVDEGGVDMADVRQQAEEAGHVLDTLTRTAATAGATPQERLERQDTVIDALEQLAAQLGADQDMWAAHGTLRSLLRSQHELQSALQALPDQGDLRDLARDELTQAQHALAQDTRRAAEDLSTLARQSNDPAITEAAQQLQQSDAAAHMDDAAAHISDDHEGLASRAQQQAADALDQITTAFVNSTRERRDNVAVLRRHVMELRELVQDLLARHTAVMERMEGEHLEGTADAMQQVRRGVLSAADRARRGSSPQHGVAIELQSAAAAQSDAIGALRMRPAALDTSITKAGAAKIELQRALDMLVDAQAALEQDATQAQRSELAGAIREQIEAQQSLITETTQSLAGDSLTRRQRHLARQLAVRQAGVGDALNTLPTVHPVLDASVVSNAAVQSAARSARAAADTLGAGVMANSVALAQERVVEGLQSVLEAINNAPPSHESMDAPFARTPSGGESGAGGSGAQGDRPEGLPAIAELRVLRQWQARLMEDTQAAVDSGDVELMNTIAVDQATLAEVGTTVLEQAAATATPPVQVNDVPGALPGAFVTGDDLVDPVGQTNDDLPSLDALLGLEPSEPQARLPEVPDDALQALSARLQQSAEALQ
ncbi:MAG: hypothetical protein MK074_09605, partial [Phycisphaerales bacterium]|nr:hypothetical protein [Phycisphaerales bacterium]